MLLGQFLMSCRRNSNGEDFRRLIFNCENYSRDFKLL